jgi:hypothetical protein
MTELNIAYSYNGNEMMMSDEPKQQDDMTDYQQAIVNSQSNSQSQAILSPQQSSPPQLSPQQLSPQLQLQQQPPNYYNNQIPPPIKKQLPPLLQRNPEYSFWDRMALSRPDVFKLVLLSFVIVLGISIERIGYHYITQYLTDNILSPIQEFIIRVSYPIMIFIFLWIIKSL